ncbi:MAG: CADD family putative folate metabolism protein [Chloroflexi bacterium]|nr:CADD family putative folate metabolism protein [Chloroflexota bacterium]
MNHQDWLRDLELEVEARHLLKHAFYQRWSEGVLSLDSLRGYACQYYHLVEAFPRFVGAVRNQCPDRAAQQLLLENLAEERTHPELWLRFAESLGLGREEVVGTDLLPETATTLETLRDLTQKRSYLEGTAALWAYESQIPAVAEKKIEGLHKFYGIDDPRGLEFFEVHRSVDLKHSKAEREILQTGVRTAKQQQAIRSAARDSVAALWRLLDGVYRAYVAN